MQFHYLTGTKIEENEDFFFLFPFEFKDKPILEKQIDDSIPSILMVKEYEKAPMHQPNPVLQLI